MAFPGTCHVSTRSTRSLLTSRAPAQRTPGRALIVLSASGTCATRPSKESKTMSSTVIALRAVDRTNVDLVGGKAATLGELAKIEDVHVPDGFCVSTEAFQRVIAQDASVQALVTRLSSLAVGDRAAITETSAAIRRIIEGTRIPDDVAEAVSRELSRLGENEAYAVRSSATAEDLPDAS